MNEKALLGESERKGYERKLEDWRSEGFDVGRLALILRDSPQDAPGAFESAEKGIHRNRELLGEFRSLRPAGPEEQVSRMQTLLRDPWMSREAENLLLELQVRAERVRKEEQRRKRESERRVGRLRERVAAWKGQGFSTGPVERALEGDIAAAEHEVERFGEAVGRLLACEEELGELGGQEFAEERKGVRGMLRDPARAQEAEEALIKLRVLFEKRRSEERLRAGQEKLARAAVRERVAAWKGAGLKVPLADDFIENAGMDLLNEHMEELEEAVARLAELREEAGRLSRDEDPAGREALSALLQDPTQVQAAEESLLRLQFASQRAARERERKAEESRRWRTELLSRVKELKGAGYDTSRVDSAFDGDDEHLRTEWVRYRIQLKRVQELEEELRTLHSEGFEREVGALVADLRRVGLDTTERVLAGKRALEEKMAARREAELRAREAEERERLELTKRLGGWIGEGYRDGRPGGLEALGSLPMPEMRGELGEVERRVRLVEQMRREVMSLDITGFETESATLLDELYDISRLDVSGPRAEELRTRILAKREEERRRAEEERRRREELRSKIAGWKKLGFEVWALEALLDGDLEFLRREYSLARMSIQRAQSLLGELAAIPAEEAGPEHAEVRQKIYTLERLDDCAEQIERLRLSAQERGLQRKKLEDLREKIREWKEQGHDVSRLERLDDGDIEVLTKEFLMFKIRIQKLRELEEELEALDTEGFESERAAIERNLKNVEALGETRDLLSGLELKIGKRMAEEVRLREERRRLQGEYIAKMSAWLEEGFHVDTLEGALGKKPSEMASDFARFERSVEEIRQIRERLEEFSGLGYDELIARIREKLREVGRIEEAKKDVHELWERVERRKKESESRRREDDDLRFGIVRQIEAWEAEGYDVGELQKLSGGRLEDLRRAVITHRMRIERMQGLEGILDAMETREFGTEAAAIRAQLKDLDRVEQVEGAIAALKEEIRGRKEEERAGRESLHRRRDECTDRFLSLLSQGYNVDTLEGALELPYEALHAECGRLEGVVNRLKEIGAELERRGLLAGNAGAKKRLFDLHALAELEEYLATGKAPWEQRPAPDRIPIIRYGHGKRAEEAPARAAAVELPELKPPGKPVTPAPARWTAPSLAAAVTGAHPGTEAPAHPPAAPAPPERAPMGRTCEGCGEPLDPTWKKCPSCLRPVGPTGTAVPRPEPQRQPLIDRIPARPEKEMGIRDQSAGHRETSRRETQLDPEKLASLRKMIDQWKSDGDDVGDLEEYLDSGVVTKEGMRRRLEAINEKRKRAAEERATRHEGPAAGEREAPSTGERPEPGEGPDGPPGERPADGPAEETAAPDAPAPGEGTRKIRKVKKVVR
ncbi:MAG: hypothetical protein FJ149_01780 [Euryarchaeota archaeon]|nr:hypothetical protein [Euryarchaeota archaeon]